MKNKKHSTQNQQAPALNEVNELIDVIENISKGKYSNDVYRFTQDGQPEVIHRISEAIGMMMVKIEAREHLIQMDNEKLKLLNEQNKKAIISTVIAMSSALGARDGYTEGHNRRTAGYSMRLSRRIGLVSEEKEFVFMGAMLHDIGKIGFSDQLFGSDDCKTTPAMFEVIRQHPEIGYTILHWLDFLGPAREFVRYHHERMDGSGYPHGLCGDQIPLGAKIIAIADTFDAITTDRPYQKGRSVEKGLEILEQISGSHLDADLVKCFYAEIQENGIE
ncbi:MAG: HD-GYP domain-containing protein [Desulfonatronovibrio sp.]